MLAIDFMERLFVADRGNARIQIFDQNGRYLTEWKQFGLLSGVDINKNDDIYVSDSKSYWKTDPGFMQGIRVGNVKDGRVTASFRRPKSLGASKASLPTMPAYSTAATPACPTSPKAVPREGQLPPLGEERFWPLRTEAAASIRSLWRGPLTSCGSSVPFVCPGPRPLGGLVPRLRGA